VSSNDGCEGVYKEGMKGFRPAKGWVAEIHPRWPNSNFFFSPSSRLATETGLAELDYSTNKTNPFLHV
jgi:hypothetical protein